jgi:hypothetical protein
MYVLPLSKYKEKWMLLPEILLQVLQEKFHYSHTPLKKWFIVQYLFFVLWGMFHKANITTG